MISSSGLAILGYSLFALLGRCINTPQTSQAVQHDPREGATESSSIDIPGLPSDKSSMTSESTLTNPLMELRTDQNRVFCASETKTIARQYGPMIPGPQFAEEISVSYRDAYRGEVIWKGDSHVIGRIANITDESRPTGHVKFVHQGTFVHPKPIPQAPGTRCTPRPLAERQQVRRFIKLVKRGCLTYISLSSPFY
jgi:hypothetical protein